MKNFLVEIKPKDKSEATRFYKIVSQDQPTAEKWGEICVTSQKLDPSKYRVVATEIITVVKTEEKPKEEVKAKPKAKPKAKKNTLKTVVDQAVKNQQA